MIVNRQHRIRASQKDLEVFLKEVQHGLGLRRQEVTVCLVTDAEIARLNRTFRRKEGPTDVLSFPANGTKPRPRGRGVPGYLGDIAIAPAVARRNARQNGRSLGNELRVLVLHGVLHLLGYDHESDKGEMERLEKKLRRRLRIE
jgi:probable rRNA maturation factor